MALINAYSCTTFCQKLLEEFKAIFVNNNPYKYNDPDGEFLNFAVKFVADVAINVAFNVVTTGESAIEGVKVKASLVWVSGDYCEHLRRICGRLFAGNCGLQESISHVIASYRETKWSTANVRFSRKRSFSQVKYCDIERLLSANS